MRNIEGVGTHKRRSRHPGNGQRPECQLGGGQCERNRNLLRGEALLGDLRAWDGVWRVPRPASYLPGLYSMDQVNALALLKSGYSWTEAQARILQAIFFTGAPLSELQRFYLMRFERLVEAQVAA